MIFVVNKQNDDHIINHITKFLKELYMMTKCEYFIGVDVTNVYHLTMLLRKVENKNNTIVL